MTATKPGLDAGGLDRAGGRRVSAAAVTSARAPDGDASITWTVGFDAGGGWLAAGAAEWVRVWDLDSGRLLWQTALARRFGDVAAVAVSPDRRWVAAARGRWVGVWALAGGDLRWGRAVLRRSGRVHAVAFSPDGSLLATAGDDLSPATASVRDAARGDLVLALDHEYEAVKDVTFSSDGDRLATAGRDGTARVWDVTGGAPLLEVAHGHAVNAVAFSPDGSRLATAGRDGTARVWDAAGGAPLLEVAHGHAVNAVAFSPDGSRLAAADGRVARLRDTVTGDALLAVHHDARVSTVAFSRDGSRLATANGAGVFLTDCGPAALGRERSGTRPPSADPAIADPPPARDRPFTDRLASDLLVLAFAVPRMGWPIRLRYALTAACLLDLASEGRVECDDDGLLVALDRSPTGSRAHTLVLHGLAGNEWLPSFCVARLAPEASRALLFDARDRGVVSRGSRRVLGVWARTTYDVTDRTHAAELRRTLRHVYDGSSADPRGTAALMLCAAAGLPQLLPGRASLRTLRRRVRQLPRSALVDGLGDAAAALAIPLISDAGMLVWADVGGGGDCGGDGW